MRDILFCQEYRFNNTRTIVVATEQALIRKQILIWQYLLPLPGNSARVFLDACITRGGYEHIPSLLKFAHQTNLDPLGKIQITAIKFCITNSQINTLAFLLSNPVILTFVGPHRVEFSLLAVKANSLDTLTQLHKSEVMPNMNFAICLKGFNIAITSPGAVLVQLMGLYLEEIVRDVKILPSWNEVKPVVVAIVLYGGWETTDMLLIILRIVKNDMLPASLMNLALAMNAVNWNVVQILLEKGIGVKKTSLVRIVEGVWLRVDGADLLACALRNAASFDRGNWRRCVGIHEVRSEFSTLL
ncbi:hypothetical protein HK097_008200 [Rhizophlyctis rosea]|uniref:Uncharacterized protein n=1 Tax=Rhizophlyctis rosea TaxID=64517 RepID=A0AAD5SQ45_9FUNG|nr:hypothetical protein HK097_008200 [Rhizophlyctis rosea]